MTNQTPLITGTSTGFGNNPKVEFENHVQRRVMEIRFPEGCHLLAATDVAALKKAWMSSLKSWHSPYTCLIDLRSFSVHPDALNDFNKMLHFFKSFFLKTIVGFFATEGNASPVNMIVDSPSVEGNHPHSFWSALKVPFEIHDQYSEARLKLGLDRGGALTRDLGDLRQRIQIENDFGAHVMEISFLADTLLSSKEDVAILKSKVTNILMQWHTPYSVMIHCLHLSFTDEAKVPFEGFMRFLKSFFCKEVIGYAPKEPKEHYPFKTYRSRHLAAGSLQHEGLGAGDKANCASKTTQKLENVAAAALQKMPSAKD